MLDGLLLLLLEVEDGIAPFGEEGEEGPREDPTHERIQRPPRKLTPIPPQAAR